MNVDGLESLFRSLINDDLEPYLVSSENFLEYLNEAQQEACIRSRLLFDRTSKACSLAVKTDVSSYKVNDSIYAIVKAFITDASGKTTELLITDRIELDRVIPEWREERDRPLRLMAYDNRLELSPAPDNDYTLKIECYKLPSELISESDVPEISKVHHRNLLYWVKYKSHSIQDVEILDKKLSEEALFMFDKIFGAQPTANKSRDNYANRPHRNKVCI